MELVPCVRMHMRFSRVFSVFLLKLNTQLVTRKDEFRMKIETIKMCALRLGVGDVCTCIGCRQKIDFHVWVSASGKFTYYACSSTSSIICWVPSLGSRVHST